MNRTARKGAILVGSMLAVASLAACQAGQAAQTSQQYNPADGRNFNIPAGSTHQPYLAVRNAVVVAYQSDASLVVTMVNHTAQAAVLQSATLDGAPLKLSGGPVEIAPRQSVSLGFGDNDIATISNFASAPGDWVDLVLKFTPNGDGAVKVLVVPYGDQYVPVKFAPNVTLPVIPTS